MLGQREELTAEEVEKLPTRYINRKKYLPYDLAKEALDRLAPEIKTGKKYRAWVKDQKVSFMPLHPERVYKNFQWSEFLGVKNEDMVARVHRFRKNRANLWPMWDAIRWSQRYCREHGINSAREWAERHDNDENIPRGIPRVPADTYRGQFPGMKVWCGTSTEGVIEAIKRVTPVLTLVHAKNVPANVLDLLSWNEGIGELRLKWPKQGEYDRIIGCWEYESELKLEIDRILSENGFSDGDKRWTFPNVNQVTWELNSLLVMVPLK